MFSSVLYFSFYHLPFITLSTYFHIFIAFHILTCDFTSYMQSSIRFFLSLKMISERSKRRKIISLVFILKCVSKKLLISTQSCSLNQPIIFKVAVTCLRACFCVFGAKLPVRGRDVYVSFVSFFNANLPFHNLAILLFSEIVIFMINW